VTQAAFDERYGDGAFQRLTERLEQPCLTFAQIADEFGVSRERVRQWHRQLLPHAPSGHERQRLCAVYRRRRRLFGNALYRAFFQRARAHFGQGRIEPVRGRSGYKAGTVFIDKHPVALRDVPYAAIDELPPGFRYRGAADYVFLRFQNDEFVFIPAGLAAAGARTWLAVSSFRNGFDAFNGACAPSTPEPQEAQVDQSIR
jgi:hypothetical protein